MIAIICYDKRDLGRPSATYQIFQRKRACLKGNLHRSSASSATGIIAYLYVKKLDGRTTKKWEIKLPQAALGSRGWAITLNLMTIDDYSEQIDFRGVIGHPILGKFSVIRTISPWITPLGQVIRV